MKKRQDIELLRIISAFAIVWYHSGAIGHEIAYGGLIVFLIISIFLAGKSNYSGKHPFLRRAERLLTPWSIWFVIYGIFNAVDHKPIIPLDNGILAGILTGTSIHLWYMPFILGCLILFDIVKNNVTSPKIAWISALLTIVILGTTSEWRNESIQLGAPIAQYAQALAAISLGAFFTNLKTLPKRIQAFLLILIIVTTLSAIPYEGVGIPYLIGTIAGCILSFNLFEKLLITDLSIISQCTLGIYFMHILALSAIRKLDFLDGVYIPIAAFLLSTIVIFLLRLKLPKLAKYAT
jgi:surface polysaccharide O-acyltransferase-like enzyme